MQSLESGVKLHIDDNDSIHSKLAGGVNAEETVGKDGHSSFSPTSRYSTNATPFAAPSSQQYPTGTRLTMIMISLMLGTLLMGLDATIVSTPIPKIATEFKSLNEVGWYGSAYLISVTAFQPVFANAYKRFDPKTTYIVSAIIFEVGSIICAAAPTSAAFIGGRAIAGLGGAGLLQGALGIVTYISTLEKRPMYMAGIVSVFGITSSCGPIVGGVFTDRVSWRWCFWVNLPFGAVALASIVLFLKLEGIERECTERSILQNIKHMDPFGIILLLGSVTCLFIALEEGSAKLSWGSPKIIGLFAGFGVIGILFWVLQWWLREDATIPFRLLNQRTVIFASLFVFLDNTSNYLKLYFLPLYFQSVLGQSAIRSGVNYIALALPQFFGLLLSGGFVSKYGHYVPVILFGQVLCCIGTGFLTCIGTETTTAYWAGFMALTGLGLGLGINAPHIAVQAIWESDSDVFIANGIATFFSQLGGSLAISTGNAVLLHSLSKSIPTDAPFTTPRDAIKAGPLGMATLTSSPEELHGLRIAFQNGIRTVMVFALVAVAVSAPVACGMEWLNVVKISQEREQAKLARQIPAAGSVEKDSAIDHEV